MKAINTILSIVIACLVLLIGWQWYHLSQNQQTITNTQPITKIRPIPTPTTSSEIVVDKTQDTQEVISTTDSVNDTSNDTTSQETGVIVLGDEPVNSDIAHAPQDTILETEIPVDDLALYENTMYGYSVAIPKNMYYAGFGARDGALHTLALQSDDVPEDFSSADIRVYYYGNKVLPDLVNAENNRYEDPAGKYVLLLLNGKTSVRIESANINSPEVLVLIQTISAGE